MKRLAMVAAALMFVGCGEDEEVAPQDRCSAGGPVVFATGQIVTDAGTFKINTSLDEADGKIALQELQIGLGTLKRESDSPNLLFKVRENGQQNDLLDNYANASDAAAVVLNVVDTSNPSETAVRRSDLSTFDCAIEDGTTCGQLALDTADPGVISDLDDKVYNFTGGTFTVEEVDNQRSRAIFSFDVELGRNILKTGDTSSGRVQGCINAQYSSAGSMGWNLR